MFLAPEVELSRVQSALNLLDAPLEADDQMVFRNRRSVFFSSFPEVNMGPGIFTYIWLNYMVDVGKYTMHGSYGAFFSTHV